MRLNKVPTFDLLHKKEEEEVEVQEEEQDEEEEEDFQHLGAIQIQEPFRCLWPPGWTAVFSQSELFFFFEEFGFLLGESFSEEEEKSDRWVKGEHCMI